MRISVFEGFLLQIILYAILWLWDEFIASYICIIFPVIIAAILLISWIADLIEPARVGRKYYLFMLASILAPILTAAFFYFISDVNLAWLEK